MIGGQNLIKCICVAYTNVCLFGENILAGYRMMGVVCRRGWEYLGAAACGGRECFWDGGLRREVMFWGRRLTAGGNVLGGGSLRQEGLFQVRQYTQSLHFPPERGAADSQKPGRLGAASAALAQGE